MVADPKRFTRFTFYIFFHDGRHHCGLFPPAQAPATACAAAAAAAAAVCSEKLCLSLF